MTSFLAFAPGAARYGQYTPLTPVVAATKS
jgi:hypothetical protein